MFLEGPLEFSPCDLMSRGDHGLEILPPQQRCTTELEGSKAGLAEQGKLNTKNLASMALIHASAANGSLASSKVGGFMA
jgi:hypothetical protein